jgi:hypothetical protein
MASTVITHFINWTFQAVGPDGARGVAAMTHQAVQRGLAALEWELSRRSANAVQGTPDQFAQYRSLPHYTQQQLEGGMRNYQRALECGAWEIAVDDAQLWFLSGKGQWTERNGSAFWKKR